MALVTENKNYSVEIIKDDDDSELIKLSFNDEHNFNLFRYRKINKYTIQQLIDDAVFATFPSSFNDPNDSTFIYKEETIKSYIKNFLEGNNNFKDELLSTYKLSQDKFDSLIDILYKTFVDSNPSLNNFPLNLVAVSCFCCEVDKDYMWAHYSSNSTGFALEYKYIELVKLVKEHENFSYGLTKKYFGSIFSNVNPHLKYPLLPIIYVDEKYDFSWAYKKIVVLLLKALLERKEINPISFALESFPFVFSDSDKSKGDDTLLANIYGRKKLCWQFEREWRLFAYNTNPLLGDINSPYVEVGHLAPKAIYLGAKIKHHNETILINIAKKKNMAIYKMEHKVVEDTIKLVSIPIFLPGNS